VKQLLPAGARIVGDPERQQLFVSGSQADIEKVNEIVGQIDKPAKAATTANPLAAGPPLPDAYRSEFIRKLQSQILLPAQQQTLPLKIDLQRQYELFEQEAQAAAQQWRQLTAKSGDVQTSAEIAAVRTRLQAAVAKAFEARQKLQQAELLEMQRRIYGLAGTIESREKLKDQIIDRRVQELLNPALDWNPPATSAATTKKSTRQPQYPSPQYPATGSPQGASRRAAPGHGVVFQIRGDLVDVSLGSDDGITAGQILHVHRGNEYVAELEVLAVQLDRLVARLKRKLSSLRPDDRVSTQEPQQPSDDTSAGTPPSDAGRPLSDAVREFNEQHAEELRSAQFPPLTDDEVVASIRWRALKPRPWTFSDGQLQGMLSIADTRAIPSNIQLYLSTRGHFDGENPMYGRFTIGLQTANSRILLREQFGPATSRSPAKTSFQSTKASSHPDSTPLSEAIQRFNVRNAEHSIGKSQPPLTREEVLSALHWWIKKRAELPITNAEFDKLQALVSTEELPPAAELEVLTSFKPNDEWQFEAWSVRLRMPRADGGGSYAYTIRDRWLKAKRIGERKISWGPETPNGVQVGLWLDPPSEVYTKGQQVVPHFFFRNSGVVGDSISLPRIMTRSYYEAIQVTDDKGETIQIDQEEGPTGPVGWTQLPFTPGAMHEVIGLPIVLGQVKRPPGVETVICAVEGQECRLRFGVDDYVNKDRAEKPTTTGQIRFRLAGEPATETGTSTAPRPPR
jgi:hypothetical protein